MDTTLDSSYMQLSSPIHSASASNNSLHQRNENIIVAVRVRPFDHKELDRGEECAWDIDLEKNEMIQIATNTKFKHQRMQYNNNHQTESQLLTFKCGNLFAPDTTTTQLYNRIVYDIVDSSMNGVNGTIFCYGQTSSGKTFTMKGTESQAGILKLAMKQVFDFIRADTENEWLLRVSYTEIYNENVRDLLNTDSSKNDDLVVHESKERGVYVNQREIIVNCIDNVLELLEAGEQQRHYGKTLMNDFSSRSHTIFKLVIESKKKKTEQQLNEEKQAAAAARNKKYKFFPNNTGSSNTPNTPTTNKKKDKVRVSVLNFVDLAGSERLSQTQAQGQQQKEGMCINKSLLFLGVVISRLSNGDKINHIPFRDSKLTRILQSSLGGNSRTAIICNVSPALTNCEHTINTLRFGANAIKIKNHAKINEINEDKAMIVQHQQEIQQLQSRLTQQYDEHNNDNSNNDSNMDNNNTNNSIEIDNSNNNEKTKLLQQEKQELEAKVEQLKRMILNSDNFNNINNSNSTNGNSFMDKKRRRATMGDKSIHNTLNNNNSNNDSLNNTNTNNITTNNINQTLSSDQDLFYRYEQQKLKINKLDGLLSELSIENTQLMSQVTELTNEQENIINQLELVNNNYENLQVNYSDMNNKYLLLTELQGIESQSIEQLNELYDNLNNISKKVLKHIYYREFIQQTNNNIINNDNNDSNNTNNNNNNINNTINLIEKNQLLENTINELKLQLKQQESIENQSKQSILNEKQRIQELELMINQLKNDNNNYKQEYNQQLINLQSELNVINNNNINLNQIIQQNNKEINELKQQNVDYSVQLLKFMDPNTFKDNSNSNSKGNSIINDNNSKSSSIHNSPRNSNGISSSIGILTGTATNYATINNNNTSNNNSDEIRAEYAPVIMDNIENISTIPEVSMDYLLANANNTSDTNNSIPQHLQWSSSTISTSNSSINNSSIISSGDKFAVPTVPSILRDINSSIASNNNKTAPVNIVANSKTSQPSTPTKPTHTISNLSSRFGSGSNKSATITGSGIPQRKIAGLTATPSSSAANKRR